MNLVNGGPDTVNPILDHPIVRAVSFVGSTPVARHIYSRAAANGKRVQAQGGAKNPIIVLPDADLDMTTRIVADSAFGNAGQRCLAASLAVTVGDARHTFTDAIAQAASERVVGFGLDESVTMGPVITRPVPGSNEAGRLPSPSSLPTKSLALVVDGGQRNETARIARTASRAKPSRESRRCAVRPPGAGSG